MPLIHQEVFKRFQVTCCIDTFADIIKNKLTVCHSTDSDALFLIAAFFGVSMTFEVQIAWIQAGWLKYNDLLPDVAQTWAGVPCTLALRTHKPKPTSNRLVATQARHDQSKTVAQEVQKHCRELMQKLIPMAAALETRTAQKRYQLLRLEAADSIALITSGKLLP